VISQCPWSGVLAAVGALCSVCLARGFCDSHMGLVTPVVVALCTWLGGGVVQVIKSSRCPDSPGCIQNHPQTSQTNRHGGQAWVSSDHLHKMQHSVCVYMKMAT
jgi:hypothetical protein